MSAVATDIPALRSQLWNRTRPGLKARKFPFPVLLLLIYLCSITLFGKGPTYIGVPPFFWGEGVMVLSCFWAFRNRQQVRFTSTGARFLAALIAGFLLLGAAEFLIQPGGITTDALRDSACCYYALFFFVGLALASRPARLALFESRWKYFWILAIPWEALNAVTGRAVGAASPATLYGNTVLSGGGEVMLSLGLGSILLLTDRAPAFFNGTILRGLLLAAGAGAFVLNGGRGVRLSITAATGFALIASIRQRGGSKTRRRLMIILLLGVVGLLIALAVGVDVVSVTYVNRFSEISEQGPQGTAQWRADWWAGIYDQVVDRNPIFGLGFGDPLWEYNPQITALDLAAHPVRSPHNYNMTIFARMGLAGSLFWGLILLVGVLAPAWDVVSPSPGRLERSRRQMFWVSCLIGIWVNASFDVQMEGPVAAIPFWVILGIVARGADPVPMSAIRYLSPDFGNAHALNDSTG